MDNNLNAQPKQQYPVYLAEPLQTAKTFNCKLSTVD